MSGPELTPEQVAFETFGEAWRRLRIVEEAVQAGEGASFTHHEAIRQMKEAAAAVRAAVLAPLAAEPAPSQAQAQAVATLRETVAWYANKSNYTDERPGEWSAQPLYSFDDPSDFESDDGRRARAALASVQALGPLFDDTPERSGSDTFEGFGGAGLALEIPLDLAQVIVEIGDAQWCRTNELTAQEHGRLMAENVMLTAQRYGLPDEREMHWVSVPGDLALAITGTSPRSPHVARALAGAWNVLRIHAQAALVRAAAAGDTPVASEPETGGEEQ